jgi:hypothetical protein
MTSDEEFDGSIDVASLSSQHEDQIIAIDFRGLRENAM